ncbi:MAG TPA: IS701 family transposase [Chloroflexota bacterium]|nr:IS701 family transposase [Chloroflexota bacterium]
MAPHAHEQIAQITAWQEELNALHNRIAPHFPRPEVRSRAGRYLAGLLAPIERRNGWQLAEQLGERTPDGVQRLLRTARWDAEAVRDDLRSYVVEHLGDPEAVLVIDETGFLKKGIKSVGVARQYSGTAGRIENCQIGVFLAYASPRGRTFLDRALYLSKAWVENQERRAAAGVPEDVPFATKGDLAQVMLERAFAANVPAAWVTGDEIYGNDGALRRWLESEGRPYVLAVARSHTVGQDGVQVRAEALVERIPAEAWQRIEIGAGSKGPRIYDWACGRLPYLTADGWGQWLVIRRSINDPEEMTFYRAYAREETPVTELARVAGTRWTIEEAFQRAKGEVGLDQYEVRRWEGWYRHVTLCLLAHAFLEVTRAAHTSAKGGTTAA